MNVYKYPTNFFSLDAVHILSFDGIHAQFMGSSTCSPLFTFSCSQLSNLSETLFRHKLKTFTSTYNMWLLLIRRFLHFERRSLDQITVVLYSYCIKMRCFIVYD